MDQQISAFLFPPSRLAGLILVLSLAFMHQNIFAEQAIPSPTAAQTQENTANNGAKPASLEERVASLEAYISNNDGSKTLSGIPGPGHNAWMMT
ncbi:MAG: hypothetical protein JOY96_03180, partial [Verrucomicrobia bacterium]|nr:hypothetical protein [Verrucomicrobiota bacterium]